jgi:hypothetical protein
VLFFIPIVAIYILLLLYQVTKQYARLTGYIISSIWLGIGRLFGVTYDSLVVRIWMEGFNDLFTGLICTVWYAVGAAVLAYTK